MVLVNGIHVLQAAAVFTAASFCHCVHVFKCSRTPHAAGVTSDPCEPLRDLLLTWAEM